MLVSNDPTRSETATRSIVRPYLTEGFGPISISVYLIVTDRHYDGIQYCTVDPRLLPLGNPFKRYEEVAYL